MNKDIAGIRRDYTLQTLSESGVAANPMEQFTNWWNEVLKSDIEEPNAMTLATSTQDGKPRARIVLMKDYNENGFVFFTNYESSKGTQLASNPFCSLLFYWKELERQVRIEGKVQKLDTADSDEYFNSRPVESKIGAWASPQSQVIENRDIIENNVARFSQKFKDEIPRPPHWGGYCVLPEQIEFWQGRPGRLHDRILYTRVENNWKIERLAP
jgi:pyridoxamine 5'-phosphate oxidase